ncbi:MAG: tetratricopeptide repeat protein [Rhodospirillaceae bacterium]|nr:tetratricopeptide repeat protein [Rhodospirillaceae bacterium]
MGKFSRILKVLPAGACALALGACGKTQNQQTYVIPEDEPKVDLKHFDAKTTSLKLADSAYAKGEYAMAAQLYFRASELQPDNAEIMVKLGYALFKSGTPQDAEKIFRAALQRDSANGEAMRGLAHSLVLQGRAEEALPVYRQALAGPGRGDVRVHAGLGAALDMVGKHAEARSVYQNGLKLAPKDFGLRNNLALSYAMTGNADKAKAVLKGLSDDPATAPRAQQSLTMIDTIVAQAHAAPARRQVADAAPGKAPPPSAPMPPKAAKVVAAKPDPSEDRDVAEVISPPPARVAAGSRKRKADLPGTEVADGVIYINTGLAASRPAPRAAVAARHRMMSLAERPESTDDAAAEVIDLLAQAERGPRFVWQEASRPNKS